MLKHYLYFAVGAIATFELARQVIWLANYSLIPALALTTIFCIMQIARA